MSISRIVMVTLTAALVSISLAGCKSSDSASPPASGGTATSGTVAATPPPSAAAATPSTNQARTTLPAACPTAAQVSSILGINAPAPNQSKTATTLDCAYIAPSSAANSLSMNFSTTAKKTPAEAEAALKAQGASAKFQAVPGVGDAAFYDIAPTGGAYIAVLSGDLAFHIVVAGNVALPKLTAMAQAILTE